MQPTLTDHKQIELAKETYRLNLAINPSFPLSLTMQEDYARAISDLKPEITPSILRKIINFILIGKIPFNANNGIVDILVGYDTYIKTLRKMYDFFNIETGENRPHSEDYPLETLDKKVWAYYDTRNISESEKEKQAEKLGFSFIDYWLMRERKKYFDRCHHLDKEAEPFLQWLEAFNASVKDNEQQKKQTALNRL